MCTRFNGAVSTRLWPKWSELAKLRSVSPLDPATLQMEVAVCGREFRFVMSLSLVTRQSKNKLLTDK